VIHEWVLILTLIGNTNQSGQAIERIPGLMSVHECMDAGTTWLRQVDAADGRVARALCIERQQKQNVVSRDTD
jgi:hypothetical protein